MDYFAGIRAFLYAAECGSFSKAADRLGVKTSTVSRYITELEKDLGIALFNRSTRGLVLTEGGRVFRQQGILVIRSLDDAREITSSLNRSPQGLLRVTIPSSFGRKHIVPHLPDFLARFPKIDLDVVVTDEVVNLVDTGFDLAVRTGALADSQLMARQLTAHHRMAFASPTYIAKRGRPIEPADLANHELLRFSLSVDDRWVFVRRATSSAPREVAIDVHGRLCINDTDSLFELAIKGHGVALLPTWACSEALVDGQLVTLMPEWEIKPSKGSPAVWAVYPRKKTVSSKVRAFIDFYSATLSRELP